MFFSGSGVFLLRTFLCHIVRNLDIIFINRAYCSQVPSIITESSIARDVSIVGSSILTTLAMEVTYFAVFVCLSVCLSVR